MILLRLFWEFFKTGLFAVGGGMATVPFLQEMGNRTGWFDSARLADMLAVSESTPGPIGINMATYAGYITAGVPGAVTATLGEVSPSILVVLIIAAFLRTFRDNPQVENVFYGIRPASTALIAAAGIGVLKICLLHIDAYALSGVLTDLVDLRALALMAVLWVLTNLVRPARDLHPLVFIAASAAAGIVFQL